MKKEAARHDLTLQCRLGVAPANDDSMSFIFSCPCRFRQPNTSNKSGKSNTEHSKDGGTTLHRRFLANSPIRSRLPLPPNRKDLHTLPEPCDISCMQSNQAHRSINDLKPHYRRPFQVFTAD